MITQTWKYSHHAYSHQHFDVIMSVSTRARRHRICTHSTLLQNITTEIDAFTNKMLVRFRIGVYAGTHSHTLSLYLSFSRTHTLTHSLTHTSWSKKLAPKHIPCKHTEQTHRETDRYVERERERVCVCVCFSPTRHWRAAVPTDTGHHPRKWLPERTMACTYLRMYTWSIWLAFSCECMFTMICIHVYVCLWMPVSVYAMFVCMFPAFERTDWENSRTLRM